MSVTDHRSSPGIRIVSSAATRSRNDDAELLDRFDPLVRYIVERHRDRVAAVGPLLAAGRQGLRDVVTESTMRQQSRDFLTTAVRSILRAVRQEIARQGMRPTPPVSREVRRAAGQWKSVHGRSPAVSELADLLSLSPMCIVGELDRM